MTDKALLGQENGQESTSLCSGAVDFDFLNTQTFGDPLLERDVLELFLAQSRQILSTVSGLDPTRQAEKAHLIIGSARGIGAWHVAEAAAGYETAAPAARPGALDRLAAAMDGAEASIRARLDQLG